MFRADPIELFKWKIKLLSDEEKSKLESYLSLFKAIQSKEPVQPDKPLQKYSDCDIYKFCERSPVFRSYIQSPDCCLTTGWSSYLKSKGYIGESLSYPNGKIKHSLYDEFMGAYLYGEYLRYKEEDNTSALKYLDLACEFNLFHALKSRCIRCQEKLINSKDDRERTLIIGQLMQDTNVLSKIYDSAGYFYSAKFLRYIGSYYSSLKLASPAHYFNRLAAESFYVGRELLLKHQLPDNQKILTAICKDAGLMHFKYESWGAAERHFLKPIDSKICTPVDIYDASLKKVKKVLSENQAPTL